MASNISSISCVPDDTSCVPDKDLHSRNVLLQFTVLLEMLNITTDMGILILTTRGNGSHLTSRKGRIYHKD